MLDLGSLLTRVRVAGVTGQMTPDLAQALLDELRRRAAPNERHAVRNQLLREAAGLISGTLYAKAKRLAAEAGVVTSSRPSPIGPADDGVRALVRQALTIDPDMPTSWRQQLRILEER